MSLPLLHAGRTNPGLSAALDLRFSLDKSLTAYRGPTPSFSRASTGSYFDGSGVLRYANVNIQPYSEQFSSWAFENSSVTSDVTVAPDGKTTADKVYETSVTGEHNRQYNNTAAIGTYTLSFYIKPAGRNWAAIYIYHPSIGRGHRAWFDVQNGVVGTTAAIGAGLTGVSSGMVSAGNGWYRCWLTATTAATDLYSYIGLAQSNGGATNYTGNGTSGIFIWGAQLEASSTVGTYCPTTSSANSAPRFNHTYNGTSWVSRGLLVEEQRTNLLTYSNTFSSNWTPSACTLTLNDTTSPEGLVNAAKITSSGGYAALFQTVSVASSTTYTVSVFAKAGNRNFLSIEFRGSGTSPDVTFDLSSGSVASGTGQIVNVGNGWFRCSVSKASVDTSELVILGMQGPSTGSSNGDYIYIFGCQLEAGAFASSLISTTSSSVTRSADVCQITGSDFSGFWNANEGTIAAEWDARLNATDQFTIYWVRDSADNNTVLHTGRVALSPPGVRFAVVSGAVVSAELINAGFPSPGVSVKTAGGYKANDFAYSYNGAAALTDTSGAVPVNPTEMRIGYDPYSNWLNGHIARLRYYRKRLPNATLQLLSEPDPTLNLQFALNKTLTPVYGPAPSFSRASTGSYFDSTGTLKYANVNLCTYSEQINDPSWNFPNNATISPNAAVSPNGTITADLLYPTASGANCYTGKSVGSVSLVTHTNSYYLKSAGKTWATIYSIRGAFIAWFNLVNGTVGTTQTGVTATIQNAGNGWWRCSVTRTTDFATGYTFVGVADSNSSESITKNGTDGILVWGAQSEIGNSATEYASTTSSTTAGPRFDHVYSGGQWVSRGLLLEEQRTNNCYFSNTFSNAVWEKYDSSISSSGTGPDGNTSSLLTENTANGPHWLRQQTSASVASGAGVSVTASIFVKANGRSVVGFGFDNSFAFTGKSVRGRFDLSDGSFANEYNCDSYSVTNVENGWYRLSVTSTAVQAGIARFDFFLYNSDTSGGITYTGDGSSGVYVFGAQIEQGAFPTSHTGTTSSSVTRSADVCQITGTSFNWMWNQGEGSFISEVYPMGINTVFNQGIVSGNDGTFANVVGQIRNVSNLIGDYGAFVRTGNSTQVSISRPAGSMPAFASSRAAFGYKLNDFADSLNGVAPITDTVGTVPTVNRLTIGDFHTGASTIFNGCISQIIYYPARLTNTKLQQLST